MTHKESEIWKAREIEVTRYREKLRRARDRMGWTDHQAAVKIKGYYDIEACEGDLITCYSMNEVLCICTTLGLHPRDLFCDASFEAISI